MIIVFEIKYLHYYIVGFYFLIILHVFLATVVDYKRNKSSEIILDATFVLTTKSFTESPLFFFYVSEQVF